MRSYILLLFIMFLSSITVSEILCRLLNEIDEECFYFGGYFLGILLKLRNLNPNGIKFLLRKEVQMSVKKSVSHLHLCISDFPFPDVSTSGKLLPAPMMSGHIHCLI